MKKTTITLASLFITQLYGCGSLLNPMFDERKVFSNERDSEVGENISWLLNHNGRYYWFDPSVEKTYNSSHAVVETSPDISEYQFKTQQCSWALDVSKQTSKVLSWKYLSDPAGCKYKKFSEGPW